MTILDDSLHRGQCLCGAVQVEADGAPIVVAHCCCLDCQRLTGAGHSTGATFPAARVRLTGELREFALTSEAGNAVTRVFCPSCGSPILGRNSGMPGFVTLSLGLLCDSSAFEPAVTIFARSRRPWDPLDAAVPSFDAQPPWRPGDPA
jgi:hypothetical protein